MAQMLPKNVVILDAGNSLIKAKTASTELSYPHALRRLTETEYQNIVTRAGRGLPFDYVRVNGQPYVVGEKAERHGKVDTLTGSARYVPDYYGVFAAATLFRLYRTSVEVALFCSHPSDLVNYRGDLANAAMGREGIWEVEYLGATYCIKVGYVNTYDEPVGGLMHVVLNDEGRGFKNPKINGGRALVIDIGGGTTDFQAVEKGGELDYSLSDSIELGIQQVERDFEKSFKATFKDQLKGMKAMDKDQIRDAIATGKWCGGGREIPCEDLVNEAISALLNRINQSYTEKAGGPYPYQHIILTGGGSAMLYNHLLPVLNHGSVIVAEVPAKMHLANVRGGRKLWKFYESEGLL